VKSDAWRENWKAAFLLLRCRKGLWRSVQLTVLLQNKKTKPHYKKQRDVKLLQNFLGTRNELRKVEEIPALELNEYICEFIISVRTKMGKTMSRFFAPKSIGKF